MLAHAPAGRCAHRRGHRSTVIPSPSCYVVARRSPAGHGVGSPGRAAVPASSGDHAVQRGWVAVDAWRNSRKSAVPRGRVAEVVAAIVEVVVTGEAEAARRRCWRRCRLAGVGARAGLARVAASGAAAAGVPSSPEPVRPSRSTGEGDRDDHGGGGHDGTADGVGPGAASGHRGPLRSGADGVERLAGLDVGHGVGEQLGQPGVVGLGVVGWRGSVMTAPPVSGRQWSAAVAQGGGAARRVALHRAAADAEGVGDLGLGQVEVVAQREHLALAARAARAARRARPSRRAAASGGLVGAAARSRARSARAACRATTAAVPQRRAGAVDHGLAQVGQRLVGVAQPRTSGRASRRRRPARPPRRCRRRAPAAPRAGPAGASARRTAARAASSASQRVHAGRASRGHRPGRTAPSHGSSR